MNKESVKAVAQANPPKLEYEIWKNDTLPIDRSYFIANRENTYEPEHNLNCPELLKAFLEKHKRKEAQRAGSSALASTSSSSLKKKDKQKLRVSFDLTDDNNTHSGSQKTSVPGIFSSDEDDEPIALSSKKGKSKEKSTENRPSKDKGKLKDKSKGASKQQSSSSTIPKYSDLQSQQRSQDEQHKPKKPSSGHPFPPKSNNIPSKVSDLTSIHS